MDQGRPSLSNEPISWDAVSEISSTEEVPIPSDPLQRVIGQDEAIELARLAASQRRHLLLVGPPGTGKSMIAQALALHLPSPRHEVRVVHNPENPERPMVEVLSEEEVESERCRRASAAGELIDPREAPPNVTQRLGYRCSECDTISSYTERTCPACGRSKMEIDRRNNPFGDLIGGMLESAMSALPQAPVGKERVTTTRVKKGREEVVVFERAGDMIRVLDQSALERRRELERMTNHKVIVPLKRNPFVLATGASETELLGDVRHDPYGSHQSLGTQPYERVVPGAIHEAHEGVLFIDEISHLGQTQRFILSAMQDKSFPITGHNPQSAGASVRVDTVPCDFILVAACNIQDLENILSPLRSRIAGGGYELLMETAMPDTPENRAKYLQFIAQEIHMDGRIPHASMETVKGLIKEGRRRARDWDDRHNALTLRLREMGGLVRAAGDQAVSEGAELIEPEHLERALRRARTVEEQIRDRYGSYMKGLSKDVSESQKERSPYYLQNQHLGDQMFN